MPEKNPNKWNNSQVEYRQVEARPPISGEYPLAASGVMQVAAGRLGILTTTSDINQAGGRATKVQKGCTWLRVYTKDPEEDTLFWNTVTAVKDEIASNPALR